MFVPFKSKCCNAGVLVSYKCPNCNLFIKYGKVFRIYDKNNPKKTYGLRFEVWKCDNCGYRFKPETYTVDNINQYLP
jgi:ribosomal protein L37AE/L43A